MGDNRPIADLDPRVHYTSGEKSYAMTGKIMLSAIIILCFVVAMMVVLHLYARWYLLRSRRSHISLRARTRPARTHFVFHFENGGGQHHPSSAAAAPRIGLDPTVIKSLPVFVHSPDTNPNPVDCAVCLSEFEEGETGRILPKCNHCFHIECIDMWFHSHSTCPLCRSPVELSVNAVGPGSLCEGPSSGSRKPMGLAGITLEVPSGRFNSGFDDDSVASTPTQFRSPVGRILSFTRILSGNGDRRVLLRLPR